MMKNSTDFVDDHFHDHCGVFGVFGEPDAAKTPTSASTPCNIAARKLPECALPMAQNSAS
jgi:hypothetical protein